MIQRKTRMKRGSFRKLSYREKLAKARGKRGALKSRGSSTAERAWRKAVLERDEYICRKCGLLGSKNMDAHHVAPRSRRPDLILVVENGIALHRRCHMAVHNDPMQAERDGLLNFDSYELAQKIKAGYVVPSHETDTRITL